ncbi:MAG: DNA repair protein RecO [Synergistaceae bacterium]
MQYSNFEKLEQGYYEQAGTVIQRKDSLKNGLTLLLFLRDLGPRWVIAPTGSSKSRFGGAIEPMVWGLYNIYQSPSGLYLKSSEIKEDFLLLRRCSKHLHTALRLYKTVSRVIFTTHESNDILNLLWSSMLLLKDGCTSELVEFRFTWRLLNLMGLAPSFKQCVLCGSLINESSFWCDDGFCCSNCTSDILVNISQLKDMRCAAMLKQEDFITWSENNIDIDIFNDFSVKLKKFLSSQ